MFIPRAFTFLTPFLFFMMIMTRKYGNMGISMQKLADAAGVRRSTVESCVRLLEPIVEDMEKENEVR